MKNRLQRAARALAAEAGPIVLLVALWALLFRRILLDGEVLFRGEIHEALYPFHRFLWDELRAGHGFPLWDPYPFFGYPLIAAVQAGVLYPPNLLLGVAEHLERALSLSIVVHLLLAGLLMYAYVRAGLRLGRAPALGAAAVFAFNGHMLGNVEQLHNHATLAWMPLTLLAIERALVPSPRGASPAASWRRETAWLCLGAVATGLSLLGGMIQQAYYFCALVFCYLAARSWPEWRAGGPYRAGARLLLRAGLLLGGAVGLASLQLFPCAEMVRESARRSLEYSDIVSYVGGSLTLPDVFGLLVLNLGDWGAFTALNTLHVGIIPVGVGLWAAVSGLRKGLGGADRFFGIAAALALAIAVGGPVFRVIYGLHLPGFGLFHDPVRVMTVFLMGVAVLWAYGLEGLRREKAPGSGGATLAGRLFGGAEVGPLASLVFLACIVGFALSLSLRGFLEGRGPLEKLDLPGRNGSLMFAFGTALAGILALGLLVAGRLRRGRVVWILSLLAFAPLCFFGWPLIHTSPNSKARGWIDGPAYLQDILRAGREATLFRVANLDKDDVATEPFETEFRVRTPTGFASLIPLRVLSFTKAAAAGAEPKRLTAYLDFLRYPGLRDLSGCRFLVARSSGPVPDVSPTPELVRASEHFSLYRNDSALPRAYLAAEARWASGPWEAMALLKDPAFDPKRLVVLEGTKGGASGGDGATGSDNETAAELPGPWSPGVEIMQDLPGRIVLSVEPGPERAGRDWLVLADTQYPGWEAQVDGKPVPILTANYLFRGLRLPEGVREVVFTYRPASFQQGLVISVTMALLIATLWLVLGLETWRSSKAKARENAG